MSELTPFEILTRRLLYLIGWILRHIQYMFVGVSNISLGFDSPLIWLTFGLFFAFAALHIFKRFLRKD